MVPQRLQGNAAAADREHTWTMVYSFHAGMGGFAIDTNDPGTHPYIKGSPRLTVTAQGAPILAEHGRLPDIFKDFIDGKSKADEIAKSLAMLQVT